MNKILGIGKRKRWGGGVESLKKKIPRSHTHRNYFLGVSCELRNYLHEDSCTEPSLYIGIAVFNRYLRGDKSWQFGNYNIITLIEWP